MHLRTRVRSLATLAIAPALLVGGVVLAQPASAAPANVMGTLQVGHNVYLDPNIEPSTIQWNAYVDSGCTDLDHVADVEQTDIDLDPEDAGYYVQATFVTNQEWTSVCAGPVALGDITADVAASFSGSAVVGGTLTVDDLAITPDPTTTTYQWFTVPDNQEDPLAPVDGADGSSLSVDASLLGQQVVVVITADADGYATQTFTSLPSDPVEAGIINLPEQYLTVTGQAKVGSALTAAAPTVVTPGTTVAYQWSRIVGGGFISILLPIDGAASATYVPTGADLGENVQGLRVTATISKVGYEDAQVSSQTVVVSPADPVTPAPTNGPVPIPVATPTPRPLARTVLTVSDRTVRRGQTISVVATGLSRSTGYRIWLAGTVARRGAVPASSEVRRTVTIPTSLSKGKHRLRVSGYDKKGHRNITLVTEVTVR